MASLSLLLELAHLHDLLNKDGEELVHALLEKHVVANIKIDQSSLVVMRDGTKLRFFNREAKTELDLVRRAASNVYEDAIAHIESRPWQNLPDKTMLFLENFNAPTGFTVKYTKTPLNNLIISYGKDASGKLILPNDPILAKAAKTLAISPPPVIFDGVLSARQKEELKYFIGLSRDERMRTKSGDNFLRFVLGLFVPSQEVDYLVANGWEGLVFYFGTDRMAKIVDPGFTEVLMDKKAAKDKSFEALIQKHLFETAEELTEPLIAELKQSTGNPNDFLAFAMAWTTEFVLRAKSSGWISRYEPFKDQVTKDRFARVAWNIAPKQLPRLVAKYWWAEDVFRSIVLYFRQAKLKANAATGITPARKEIINGIVEQLRERGVIH